MSGLFWNCRGLNDVLAPTIPKLRALSNNKYYDFLFIIETKCKVESISTMFRSLGFVKSAGVDPLGTAGGLWVGWKKDARMSVVELSPNFLILLIEKYNGLPWYLVLFYGASQFSLRFPILKNLEESLGKLEYPYLIIGDFNQVEYACDKNCSNTSQIPGAYKFINWKVRNELLDIPFKGPQFTWCNNRQGNKRVYERLDKAFASKDWFTLFPDTGVKHFPIQISNHAPIEVDLNLTKNTNKKPYKLDAWALDYPDCLSCIKESWCLRDVGSPAFRVVKKLSRVRQCVKKWTLDKRMGWTGKWDDFDKRLKKGMEEANNGGSEEDYTRVNEEVRSFAKAIAIYWKQRAKLRWMVDGDTCTKYFFNWVKGRAGRNFILGIKGGDGT
ncbi:uncharacterized protein LOC141649108 [Silene latifolia]|uniref:uncharacterized protein LOC141649108 n=1 Tax=Silene latifolia TaxID=37657 RepID=UPI003D76CAF5